MPETHSTEAMQLALLRAFLVVSEVKSISAAAARLHVGQPALTRQIASLEAEVGAQLFERGSRGVRLTAAGQRLAGALGSPLQQLEQALAACRAFASGVRAELRVGYLQWLARSYLNPALAAIRSAYPDMRVRLLDACAVGQIAALEKEEIDVALVGPEGRALVRDFYTRTLRRFGVVAALPADHRAIDGPAVPLADLRRERFIGKSAEEESGYNAWVTQVCRRAGFRPRFVAAAESMSQMLSLVVSEGGVALLPEGLADLAGPSVVMRPIADARAHWELLAVWQRGRLAPPVRTLLRELEAPDAASSQPRVLAKSFPVSRRRPATTSLLAS